MQNADHPIWPIIRTAIILIALAVTLYITAEHFDKTEIQTIITMFLAILGAEGIPAIFKKKE